MFSLVRALPPQPPLKVTLRCSAGSRVSGRRWRTCVLATVRRPNCTDGFPVCSFHEDSEYRDAPLKELTEPDLQAHTVDTASPWALASSLGTAPSLEPMRPDTPYDPSGRVG